MPNVPEVIYSNTRTHTHMVITKPEIVDTTRGISHITADKAVEDGSPDIGADSQWVFTGNVHADTAQGQLRANTATVQLTDSSIAWIKAQGSPALFQRLPNSPLEAAGSTPPTPAPVAPAQKTNLANLTVHGHADSITYDANDDQVLLNGNSWFTDGCNDIISQQVTYNMASQTVEASAAPGSNARVHGTIRNTHPGSSTSCSTATGASPTTSTPGTPAASAPAQSTVGAGAQGVAGSPVSRGAVGSPVPGAADGAGTGKP